VVNQDVHPIRTSPWLLPKRGGSPDLDTCKLHWSSRESRSETLVYWCFTYESSDITPRSCRASSLTRTLGLEGPNAVKIASPFREGLLLLCAFNYLKKINPGAVRTQRTGLATLGSSVVEPCPWETGGKGAIGADERSCLALKDNEYVPSSSAQGSSYEEIRRGSMDEASFVCRHALFSIPGLAFHLFDWGSREQMSRQVGLQGIFAVFRV